MQKQKLKAQIVRHGELLLKPVNLPSGAILKESTKKKIVAFSETHHHHVLEATKPKKHLTLPIVRRGLVG